MGEEEFKYILEDGFYAQFHEEDVKTLTLEKLVEVMEKEDTQKFQCASKLDLAKAILKELKG